MKQQFLGTNELQSVIKLQTVRYWELQRKNK